MTPLSITSAGDQILAKQVEASVAAYFKYPEDIRKAIYTTNAAEAVHRQFRKLTKTKGGFANENALLKLLYAGMLKAGSTSTWICEYELTQNFEHPR